MPGRRGGSEDVPALRAALALLRERAGVSTQEALAQKLGISSQSVSSREAGADAKWSTIERTLGVLGMTVRDLDAALREVRGEPPRNNTPPPGTAPPEAQAILRPQIEDELVRQEVDRRVAQVVAAILREMKPAPERRSNGS